MFQRIVKIEPRQLRIVLSGPIYKSWFFRLEIVPFSQDFQFF